MLLSNVRQSLVLLFAAAAIILAAGSRVEAQETHRLILDPVNDDLGMRVAEIPGRGVLVTTVYPGSQAERWGFERGDVIVQVNQTPITGIAALYAALPPNGGQVYLGVRDVRTGRVQYVYRWMSLR